MSLLSFLGFGSNRPEPPGPDKNEEAVGTLRKIVSALERMEPARARHIAAFAFILSRVANADSNISDEETRAMERAVMTWASLPEEQAVLVVQIAKHQNVLFGGTDNFIVTREFNATATREEKEDLLHCLFAVSAADDSISSMEEATISQIARELGFTNQEHVSIRSAYRNKRAVLKDLPR